MTRKSTLVRAAVASVVLASFFAGTSRLFAVALKPSDPNFAWLLDGNNSALFGGQNGTRTGAAGSNPSGPEFVTDVPLAYDQNRALEFDGTDDEFVVADTAALRPGTGAWTTSFWFKADDADQTGGIIAKRQNSGSFNQLQIAAGTILGTGSLSPSKKLSIIIRASSTSDWWFHTTDDIIDGEWHHVGFVRAAAGGGTMYVDGQLEALTQAKLTGAGPRDVDNTVPWIFGSNNGSDHFEGLVDEVAFWNIELTGDNMEWLAFRSFSPDFVVPEPSSASLLGLAVLMLAGRGRSRKGRSVASA